MISGTRKEDDLDSLQKIVVVLFSIVVLTPYVTRYYLPFACCIALLFYMTCLSGWLSDVFNDRFIRTITLFFVWSLMLRVTGYSTASWGNYALKFLLYTSACVGVYVVNRASSTTKNSLYTYFIVIFTVNVIDNIRLYNLSPGISPNMYEQDLFHSWYGRLNVGDTSFKYVVLLMSFCLLVLSLNGLKGRKKVVALAVFSLCSYFTIFQGLSTTVVISFVIGTMTLICCKGKSIHNIETVLIITIIFIVLLFLMLLSNIILPGLAKFASNNISERVGERIEAINRLLNGYAMPDDKILLARLSFIQLDLQSFVSSVRTFFIGNGFHTASSANAWLSASLTGDGGHSGIFDVIARYGMVGVVYLVFVIRSSYGKIVKSARPDLRSSMLFVYGLSLLNAIFNIFFHHNIIFVLMCVFPCALVGIEENK
jgi:hypothetical protein